MAHEVSHALNNAAIYKFPDVRVNVYLGQVQLSGFVATERQRETAGGIAGQVPGVATVENDLHVTQAPESGVGGSTGP